MLSSVTRPYRGELVADPCRMSKTTLASEVRSFLEMSRHLINGWQATAGDISVFSDEEKEVMVSRAIGACDELIYGAKRKDPTHWDHRYDILHALVLETKKKGFDKKFFVALRKG